MSLAFTPQLFWVDLEMSGLDPMKHRILEFACILTDGNLQHRVEGPHMIIQCDEEHLQGMDEWCTRYYYLNDQAITQNQDYIKPALRVQ